MTAFIAKTLSVDAGVVGFPTAARAEIILRRSTVDDSFVIIPSDFRRVVTLSGGNGTTLLIPNTNGSIYEVTIYDQSGGKLAQFFFMMPDSNSVLSQIAKTTSFPIFDWDDKEPKIAFGDEDQYWAGNKEWKDFSKALVGLGNVDNTSDLGKPISTAAATAFNVINQTINNLPDANVKVLQPFTGAIERTQHDKNAEFVSVKDFGAIGDGITDDADAIISAINSGAKYIYFNDGIYKISKTINLIDNIKLYGGSGAKIKSLVPIAMQAKTKSNITIEGLEFEGAGASVVPTVVEDGLLNFGTILSADACTNVTVKNCKVHSAYTCISARYGENTQILDSEVFNFSLYGVILSRNNGFNVSRNWVHDSIVTGSNAYCVMATGGGGDNPDQTQCKIVGNRLENVPSWSAIMSHSIQSLIVADNTMINVRNGVDITVASGTQIRNVIVSNNYIEGTSVDSWSGGAAANTGVFIATGGTVAVNTAANIVISGNIISKFGSHNQPTQGIGAILLSNAANVSVNGNTIIQPDGISNSVAGIFVSSFNSNLSIVGNIVRSENIRSCITVANATIDGLSIVGNVFSHSNSASTSAKIRIQSSTIDGVSIEANAGQRGKRNYEEVGTNVIDGVSAAAPFGGRAIAKKLSMRVLGAAVTSLAPQASFVLADITINDAQIGDTVAVGYAMQSTDCIISAFVVAANLVRVTIFNISTATISKAAATVSVDVFKHS